jgi:FlaG/FlaF family flagellin (archaellin)
MNKNTIAIVFVLAAGILSFAAAVVPLVYAQSLSPTGESETETEQEIKQKNVCSGWAVCTNIAENR